MGVYFIQSVLDSYFSIFLSFSHLLTLFVIRCRRTPSVKRDMEGGAEGMRQRRAGPDGLKLGCKKYIIYSESIQGL